jgi:hypothetical protein
LTFDRDASRIRRPTHPVGASEVIPTLDALAEKSMSAIANRPMPSSLTAAE